MGRLSRNTTGTILKDYLQNKGIAASDITYEELRTIGPNKAFKLGIPFHHLEQAEGANFWPKGVLVRPFRAPRRRYQEGTDLVTTQHR